MRMQREDQSLGAWTSPLVSPVSRPQDACDNQMRSWINRDSAAQDGPMQEVLTQKLLSYGGGGMEL